VVASTESIIEGCAEGDNPLTDDDKQSKDDQRWSYGEKSRLAERYHDKNFEFARYINEAAVNNANIALRALLILNGGAAVSILAFAGNFLPKDPSYLSKNLSILTSPLVWFAWGAALSPFAMAFAYFTNYSNAAAASTREHSYEYPYVYETDRSKRWGRMSVACQIMAVVIAFGSLGCFLFGMYEVRQAILAMH
jgi:hypothetical protein